MRHPYRPYGAGYGLNESPSEKEGKFNSAASGLSHHGASMKALPRRKGNVSSLERQHLRLTASMKAPPKRKGNAAACATAFIWTQHLNEGPYKIVGKSLSPEALPPCGASLNESPSQKEGKS